MTDTKTNNEWEKEWAVIQEREYDNCLTKGLTDIQAQQVIDEHDKWFHSILSSERQRLGEEIEKMKKYPTEDQEEGKEYDEGFDQALSDILKFLEE